MKNKPKKKQLPLTILPGHALLIVAFIQSMQCPGTATTTTDPNILTGYIISGVVIGMIVGLLLLGYIDLCRWLGAKPPVLYFQALAITAIVVALAYYLFTAISIESCV